VPTTVAPDFRVIDTVLPVTSVELVKPTLASLEWSVVTSVSVTVVMVAPVETVCPYPDTLPTGRVLLAVKAEVPAATRPATATAPRIFLVLRMAALLPVR